MINKENFLAILQKHRVSLASQNTYNKNHQFNCNKKCLVYLVTCDKCLKEYVGQARDEFRRQCNNHKSNEKDLQKLEHYTEEHLFNHF